MGWHNHWWITLPVKHRITVYSWANIKTQANHLRVECVYLYANLPSYTWLSELWYLQVISRLKHKLCEKIACATNEITKIMCTVIDSIWNLGFLALVLEWWKMPPIFFFKWRKSTVCWLRYGNHHGKEGEADNSGINPLFASTKRLTLFCLAFASPFEGIIHHQCTNVHTIFY